MHAFVEDFVATALPSPPARVLEVGCGKGDLARYLSSLGHVVTAIDPEAPPGPIFRKVSLEGFSEEDTFDAVVASRSLHHVPDLDAGLRKIHTLLRRAGVLVLNEFAWERMDRETADWYLSHIERAGSEPPSLLPESFPDAWIAEHEGMHTSDEMREGLDGIFHMKLFEWVPYVSVHYLERDDLLGEERRLIGLGRIQPLGFHYVGLRS
ncbi:MAG: class I SAM-dependent methyltransferase [Actinomycetota bacterium]